MAFVATNASSYADKVVGDGECVAFVKECSGAPVTTKWVPGVKVKDNDVASGTAIATFKDGKYPSQKGYHVRSLSVRMTKRIVVWDQWKGQPVHKRTIGFMAGEGKPSNDGDAYSVIETS